MVLEGAGRSRVTEGDHGAASLGEVTGQRVHEQEGRDGVDRDGPLEVLATELVERGPRERAAGEDDVVDAAALRRHRDRGAEPLHDVLDRVPLLEIGADEGRRPGPAGRSGERSGQLLELRGVPGGENDLVTPVGQGLGNGDSEGARWPPRRGFYGSRDRSPSCPSYSRNPVHRGLRRKGGVARPDRV